MIDLAVISVLMAAVAPAPLYDVTYTFTPADGTAGHFLYQLRASVDGQEATIDSPGVNLSASVGSLTMDLDFAAMTATLRSFHLGMGTGTQAHSGTVTQAGVNPLTAPFTLHLNSQFVTEARHGPFAVNPSDSLYGPTFGQEYEDAAEGDEYNLLEGDCVVGGQTLSIHVSLPPVHFGPWGGYFTTFQFSETIRMCFPLDLQWSFGGAPLVDTQVDGHRLELYIDQGYAVSQGCWDGRVQEGRATVYRFWSPISGRHFYTISETERDKLRDRYASIWTYEGTAWFGDVAPGGAGLAPVYRFWSEALNAHFYTIREAEKQKLCDQYSDVWMLEGIAYFAYAEDPFLDDVVPVHRFWSGVLNCHFYTISDTEVDKLLREYADVWTYEGVAWYAYFTIPTYAADAVLTHAGTRLATGWGSAGRCLRAGGAG